MRRTLVFGQANLTEEATRHSIICSAVEKHSDDLLFNTTTIGFARPDAHPRIKLLTAITFCPVRWMILFFKYLCQKEHDVVLLPYPSYMDGWLAGIMARFKNKKIILDAFVPIYDTLVNDRKMFCPSGIVAKILYAYEKFLLRLADVVLVDTIEHQNMLENMYNLTPGKITPVPVGVDEKLWRPLPPKKTGQGFNVLFWCTFIPLHGAHNVLDAAAIVQKKNPGIRFQIIGTGQQADSFRLHLNSLSLENLTWINRFLSLDEIYKCMAGADCCLGVFGIHPKTQRVIPYKAYQTLASARPLITAGTEASRRLFTHRENAILVSPGDPAQLADAILHLSACPTEAEKIGYNGRTLYEKHLSNKRIAKSIEQIFESL